MRIAYLANSYPEAVESYVWDEIEELRRQSAMVAACSVKRPATPPRDASGLIAETRYLLPLRLWDSFRATLLLVGKIMKVRDLVRRVVSGPEHLSKKIRTLAHTWLGAYLAVRLRDFRPEHIHVHHGYFASWVGMVAARLMGASFSMTLHGSDLLVRADYLDIKLANCTRCFTVSDHNRRYLLDQYPHISAERVVVCRLGIDLAEWKPVTHESRQGPFRIACVGRLHAVKNHAFLLLACRTLKDSGIDFECLIAGEGEERKRIEYLIRALSLQQHVRLLGHVVRSDLPSLYAESDVVVLTSRSEGVPVTLMEAMAMERTVVAPNITGIPELVIPGKTGFLYRPNSIEDFIVQLNLALHSARLSRAKGIAARQYVLDHFNGPKNTARFAEHFLGGVRPGRLETVPPAALETNENPVLQQI